jgi:hypothetical protein
LRFRALDDFLRSFHPVIHQRNGHGYVDEWWNGIQASHTLLFQLGQRIDGDPEGVFRS